MAVLNLLCILFVSSLASAELPDLKTFYFSVINPSEGILIDLANPTHVAETPFSNEKDTIIYIHGWLDDVLSLTSSGQKLKYILLQKYDVNVFLIDWSSTTKNMYYPVVAQEVRNIGKALGDAIWSMVENNGLHFAKITIIGASLGAHVAGVAGRELDGQVRQIVGIDPSGLLFAQNPDRLTESSAKFVEVIHTCGGRLGYLEPLGHADYYPNGGRYQPICGSDGIGMCSESMALTYYCESISGGKFISKKCTSYENFKKGVCEGGEKSWMGGYDLDRSANGIYFLETNNFPPYAKN